MQIRNVFPEDYSQIDDLIIEAFGQTDEARLTELLRNDEDLAVELVAEEAGQIFGHIALSRFQSPSSWLALAPLSVTTGKRRKGVGALLVTQSLEAARKAGWVYAVVLGDPKFYSRFGFSVEAASSLNSPYPLKYTGLCRLQPQHRVPGAATGALPNEKLIYAKAFSELGV